MKAVNRQCYSISDGLFNWDSRDPSSVWVGFPCLLLVVVMCPAGELPKKSTKRAGSLGDKVVEAAQTECAVQSEKGGHVTALSLWSCRPQQCELALQDNVTSFWMKSRLHCCLSPMCRRLVARREN